MRWRGIRVDLEKANDIQNELGKKEEQILFTIKKQYNRDVEIWNSRSIGELFDKGGLSRFFLGDKDAGGLLGKFDFRSKRI